MGVAQELDGLFYGKSHLEMDDAWVHPYDSGNLQMVSTCFNASDSLDRGMSSPWPHPPVPEIGRRQSGSCQPVKRSN